MRIQPTQPQNAGQSKTKTDYAELLFFIALNVLVVPFSAYQTFVGYERDVADGKFIIAAVVALISGVLFAAMNFGIRKDRLEGKRHLLKVFMYIVPIGLSFPGNFNAFYSNQMKDSLLRTEINSYRLVLTSTKDIATDELNKSIGLYELQLNFDSKRDALKTEYQNKPTGWGKNCNSIWVNLCSFLKSEGGTVDATMVAGIVDGNQKITKAIAFAENDLKTIISNRQNKINPTLNAINTTYSECDNYIDSLLNLSTPVYTSAMLDKIVTAENLIRSKAGSFLNRTDLFPHEALKSSNENELGTIKHSFNSAFVKKENPTATAFSLFLSLIIDFAALLYILVFIPFNTGKKKGRIETAGPNRI
jgi:hypothetical protein